MTGTLLSFSGMALSVRAMVQACTGRADGARVDAERALSLAGDRSVALARIHATWALGLIDLDQGRPGDAADRLGALRVRLVAAGVGEPAAIPFAADEVEALVAAGRVTDAVQVVEWLEERGQALDRASALAAAWRGRGLLAAASGEHFGLRGIRERVDKLGGALSLDCRDGGGTRLAVQVPMRAASVAAE